MHPSIHSQKNPDRIAHIVAGTGESVTYAQLEARSNQGAHAFRSLGLKRGDVVAMLLENTARNLDIAWAAQRCGLYLTCISPRLSPRDIAYIVADSGASVLVTSPALSRYVLDSSVLDSADQTSDKERYVLAARILTIGENSGPQSWQTLCAAMPATPIADECPGSDMLYSSGTTGRPKGVKGVLPEGPLAQPNGLTNMGSALYGMDSDTVFLSPAPLYHAAPLRWCMAVQKLGGTVVIMEKFDAAEALALIEKFQVTHAQWVPTHFVRMLKLPESIKKQFDLSSLQAVFHAAAPCPIHVKEAMIDWWGPIVHEFYSGTECPGITAISAREWLARKGSVGRAILGTVKICDDNGNELPAGEQGLVYFADGPTFEYHNDPDKTKRSRNKYGWATLGDVGHVDTEGYLYLTDRKDFMIICGGVNIYPQEIENCLLEHASVADVAVVGIPDDEMGERVLAVIQPSAWADAGDRLAEQLREFAQARLGKIKTPRQFVFWEKLPRLPTGKIVKRAIRQTFLEQP